MGSRRDQCDLVGPVLAINGILGGESVTLKATFRQLIMPYWVFPFLTSEKCNADLIRQKQETSGRDYGNSAEIWCCGIVAFFPLAN